MEKGALYIRVSTHDQLEFSPDAQKKALFEYAKRNDIIIDSNNIYVDEGISGRKAEKRPEFMRMINDAKTNPPPFQVILVHKFDRFSRNREDSVVYKSLLKKECGIRVISITEQIEDDKFSVILESMLEAMAEYYSLNLGDEVKKGMLEKARRGGFQGSPPYGYKIESKGQIPIIVEEEAAVIRIIYDKFVNELKSYRQIATYLNNLSYRTKKGNLFESRGVKYILENPFYYGDVRWNYRKKSKLNNEEKWIIAKGSHKPIIEKKVWNNARNRMKTLDRIQVKNSKPCSQYRHWLSGIMKCSYCGGTMSYTMMKNKYEYFRCNKHLKGSCSKANYIPVKTVEEIVIQKIKKDLLNIELIIKQVYKHKLDEIDQLNKKLKAVRSKYELASNAYLNKVDTLEEYQHKKMRIKVEEKSLLECIESIKVTEGKKRAKKDKLEVDEVIDLIKSGRKKRVLHTFIKNIIVNADDKIIYIEYYIDR